MIITKLLAIYSITTLVAYFYISGNQKRVVQMYLSMYISSQKREQKHLTLGTISDSLAVASLIPIVRVVIILAIMSVNISVKKEKQSLEIVDNLTEVLLSKTTYTTTLDELYNQVDKLYKAETAEEGK